MSERKSLRQTVKKMLAHYERSFECDKDNIDFDRTPLNKSLAPNRPEGQEAYLDELLSEVSTIKSNTNILSDWIITLPQNEELEEREDEFFKYAYQRIVEMLPEGERCIISAYTHYDEAQPHIHIAFCGLTTSKVTKNTDIPQRWTEKDAVRNPELKAGDIKRDKKGNIRYIREDVIDGEGNPVTKTSLSQSGIFNRAKMASFHSDLESVLCKDLGLKHVGVLLDEDAVIQKTLSCIPHEHLDSVKKHFEQRETQIKMEEKNQASNLRVLETREKELDEREFDLNIRENNFYQDQANVLSSVETAREEISKSKNTLTAEEWGYSFKKKLPSLIPNEKIRNTLAICIDRYISFVNRDVVKAISVAKELLSRRGKSREELSNDVFASATDIEQKQKERERQGKGGLSR